MLCGYAVAVSPSRILCSTPVLRYANDRMVCAVWNSSNALFAVVCIADDGRVNQTTCM